MGGPNYTKFEEDVCTSQMLPKFVLVFLLVAPFGKPRASNVTLAKFCTFLPPPCKNYGMGGQIV